MKIATIIGARPQFIKAATVSRVIKSMDKDRVKEIIIHTGQHYDDNMSKVFFEELDIPEPNYNLEVGSSTHGKQTAMMLERIEEVLMKEKPDWVLLYGDTNSTVAGALAATKLHIKVAHVEAGLRSFNMNMPEEINRIVTSHIANKLFAPTQNAMDLLAKEGLADRSYFTGDVMFDSILFYTRKIEERKIRSVVNLDNYYLATVHRQENTEDINRLQNIFSAFSELNYPVVLPLHPRTRKYLAQLKYNENVRIIEPVSYLEMILLIKNAKKILTDSGGLQKEAYFLKKPCITLRDETEWVETLNNNWNFIVGANRDLILKKIKINEFGEQGNYFGDGKAANKIVNILIKGEDG